MAGELGTASPRGLSRLRRDKNLANASTNSLASTSSKDMPDQATEGVGLRGTMDHAFDKVMAKARRSSDDRRGSNDSAGGNRLSAIVNRRRKPKQKDALVDESRPISVRSADSETGDLAGLTTGNRSDLSLGDGSGNSSLLTDGYSDDESRSKPTRPTISPHQSHIGYLTLSSPQLNAQAGLESQSNAIDAVATSTSQPDIPSIIEPAHLETNDLDSSNREPSPGAKLKSAFTINRKKPGEDTDSIKSATSGGAPGLGGLLKRGSRRNSVASQNSVEPEAGKHPAPTAAASVPAVQQSEEQPNTPSKARGRTRINTNPVPSTPPNLPGTPTTLVTPPTPTDPTHSFPRASTSAGKQSPTKPLSSVESIRHRRAQSTIIPSKLSAATAAPLTPTLEEAKTPGGTLTQPTSASGFFTSVFSAAQKAADQLSNSINTPAVLNQKSKPAPTVAAEEGGEEVIPGIESSGAAEEDQRQPAVQTLGKGDLSLSHLGIADSQDTTQMNSVTDLPRQDGQINSSSANKAEEAAAARAVSVAYEKPVASTVSQAMGGRPMSIASQDHLTLNGDQTPPRTVGDSDGIKRSGSVRSKLSGRRRRHRGSSATTTTNNTIAAALRDSASGIASANASGPGHRLTGFAVASSKRNKDFHQLFRSVPDDDYLIEDYSAALQRDILLHGRLYVSEGHICFSSNIFGWVTNLVISFDEVVSVEKKSTAVVFPNAIVIQTLQARNTFASLVARESTYDLLIGIWKISHPNLKSSLNGVTLQKGDGGTGDKTEKADSIASDGSGGSATDDEVYDEDEDDASIGSFTEADASRSVAGSEFVDLNPLSRKTSAQPVTGTSAPNSQPSATSPKGLEGSDAVVTGAAVAQDFPGPATHAPTECGCTADHYDRPLTDTVIPAPLGKVYSLMYGPASGAFMNKWLIEDQKSRELNYTDDKTGLDNEHKSFVFDYIKPLNNSVGPKQTKCITTNTLEQFDLDKAISINCSTQTPDVPSGNVFTTKTRYCLMWAPGNSTRMIANCTIEWTGKSWLKGPIEGGAQGGQVQYVKDIIVALKAAVVTKPAVKGAPRGKNGKRKGKKEIFDAADANEKREAAVAKQEANWGLFEPVRPLLEPVGGLLKPFVSSQVVIAVLAALLVYTWVFPGGRGGSAVGGYGVNERMGVYEELWRREEAELWDWLEDRVGLGEFEMSGGGARQQVLAQRDMSRRLKSEGMREREVREAIRVTEEKLGVLKGAVEGNGKGKGDEAT